MGMPKHSKFSQTLGIVSWVLLHIRDVLVKHQNRGWAKKQTSAFDHSKFPITVVIKIRWLSIRQSSTYIPEPQLYFIIPHTQIHPSNNQTWLAETSTIYVIFPLQSPFVNL
jgi:hypothetical protein